MPTWITGEDYDAVASVGVAFDFDVYDLGIIVSQGAGGGYGIGRGSLFGTVSFENLEGAAGVDDTGFLQIDPYGGSASVDQQDPVCQDNGIHLTAAIFAGSTDIPCCGRTIACNRLSCQSGKMAVTKRVKNNCRIF